MIEITIIMSVALVLVIWLVRTWLMHENMFMAGLVLVGLGLAFGWASFTAFTYVETVVQSDWNGTDYVAVDLNQYSHSLTPTGVNIYLFIIGMTLVGMGLIMGIFQREKSLQPILEEED